MQLSKEQKSHVPTSAELLCEEHNLRGRGHKPDGQHHPRLHWRHIYDMEGALRKSQAGFQQA